MGVFWGCESTGHIRFPVGCPDEEIPEVYCYLSCICSLHIKYTRFSQKRSQWVLSLSFQFLTHFASFCKVKIFTVCRVFNCLSNQLGLRVQDDLGHYQKRILKFQPTLTAPTSQNLKIFFGFFEIYIKNYLQARFVYRKSLYFNQSIFFSVWRH